METETKDLKYQEEYLTYEDVARILQVDPKTVENYVLDGQIAAVHFTKKNVRITRSAFEEYVRLAATGNLPPRRREKSSQLSLGF